MRNAFIRSLTRLSQKNKNIILLTGDLGYTVFETYSQKFPRRFLNLGVLEANMMGVACGMAMEGMIPVVYSIATFASMRGYEQVRGDICLHNANVKIVGSGAGLSYGHAGASHHALEDIAIMRVLPNMTILCPSDGLLTELAVEAMVSHHGPVYLRLGKKGEPVIYKKKPKFKIGKAIVLADGRDATIIATGNLVYTALVAAEFLSKLGLKIGVVDMHTIKPLDQKLINDIISSSKAIFSLEEHQIIGGLGSAIAEVLAESGKKILFKRLGVMDTFIEDVGNQEYLRGLNNLNPEKIKNLILTYLKNNA